MKEKGKSSKTNWKKVDAMTDDQIDYSDIPELDETFWKKAKLVTPKNKVRLTIRLDEDIVTWFQKKGKGYQTKINSVLKSYIKAIKKRHAA